VFCRLLFVFVVFVLFVLLFSVLKEKENKTKTYNNLQNTTQKTKDRATRTPQKQTIIYKTLHRKLKIEQHEHH
jgi:hypothetical protein